MPSPHCSTKARSAMPEMGIDDREEEPRRHDGERDPLPAAERQKLLPRRLALDRHVLARGLEQPALQQHQRKGHRDDAHRNRRHEVIGGRAELVGQLVQVGRQHEVALGIAEDQRQAEELEAQKEHQHRGVEQGGHGHRQADVERDAQRIGADHARRFLDVGAEALQRRRRIQVDVRHVGQAGDDRNAGQRIDVPRNVAEEVLGPQRIESDRPHGHDVAESEHHRRDEHRHEHQHLDDALAGQIGAGQEERERCAERQRDEHHPRGDDDRIEKRVPEVGVVEDEPIGVEAEVARRVEKRGVEEALPEDQRQRRENDDRRNGHHGNTREAEGAGSHCSSVAPACRYSNGDPASWSCERRSIPAPLSR